MIQPSFAALSDGEVYVPGLPTEYVTQKYGIPPEQVAKLGSAENPHGTSPKALRAVEQVLSRMDLYPDWTARRLREAIAQRYGFDPEGVVCGSGETEVISMVIRAFAAPGQPVLMHAPCFPLYRIYANVEGRRPVFLRMGRDFDPLMDEYLAALRERPRIAFLTTPHNPSGRLIGEADVRRVCENAHEDTLVVVDEAYIHYSRTEGSLHLLREYRNLLVLRTFSKAFGLAGLRVGFGISANPALIQPLWRIKPTWNIGQLQLAGAIAALQDDEHVQRAVDTVVEMRGYVAERMGRMQRFRMVPHSRANFFLTEILDPALDSTAVFNGLLERGVIVKNGVDIEGLGPRYLRVDLNLKRHMDRFLSALDDLPAR
ncbi:MAG TPA: histidinol-phosphate transaminase [Ramlibacter sp.]|nr:histidinol-phosphate transaminase [Ramlibacter sp.]